MTLHALANREDVGTYHAASALFTLAHEAVHQRGGIYANPNDPNVEGLTDCAALPLVPGLAVSYFGVSQLMTENYVARVVNRVRKKRVVSYVTRSRTVSNFWLARLAVDALPWHRAKPAAYQGNC